MHVHGNRGRRRVRLRVPRQAALFVAAAIPELPVRLWLRMLGPQPSMEFIGALLCGDLSAPLGHRVNMAWNRLLPRAQMFARALIIRVRLHKILPEILPMWLWGSSACRLRADVTSATVAALTTLTCLLVRARHPAEES